MQSKVRNGMPFKLHLNQYKNKNIASQYLSTKHHFITKINSKGPLQEVAGIVYYNFKVK